MSPKPRSRAALLLAALAAAPVLLASVAALPPCAPQRIHIYGGPAGAAHVASFTVGADAKAGHVRVWDTNLADCDGDGVPADFDGDYEAGVGGGFFGFGPWAAAALCGYGLNVHGPDVLVYDFVFSSVVFEIGADDMLGPLVLVDPVTGAVHCETDGVISPAFDVDDCLAGPYFGLGATCGGGGDGGYWVILDALVDEPPGGLSVSNPATTGLLIAGAFGAPLVPYAGIGVASVERG